MNEFVVLIYGVFLKNMSHWMYFIGTTRGFWMSQIFRKLFLNDQLYQFLSKVCTSQGSKVDQIDKICWHILFPLHECYCWVYVLGWVYLFLNTFGSVLEFLCVSIGSKIGFWVIQGPQKWKINIFVLFKFLLQIISFPLFNQSWTLK